MPLLEFHLIEHRDPGSLRTLLDAAHAAVVEAFEIPVADRYQLVTTHPAREVIALDTALGISRSNQLVIIQVVSLPRPRQQKEKLYRLLADYLYRDCGLSSNDLIVSIVENTSEDWSFGFGRAQFLTGELDTPKGQHLVAASQASESPTDDHCGTERLRRAYQIHGGDGCS